MKASEMITKARIKLVLEQPFFATLALNMEYVEDSTRQTACTNGKQIRYNPKYVESLGEEMTKTLIAHEVLHPALLHHTRRGDRDFETWNRACDYALNPFLQKAGFKFPKDWCFDPAYEGKSAEQIYDELTRKSKEDKQEEQEEQEEEQDDQQDQDDQQGDSDDQDQDQDDQSDDQQGDGDADDQDGNADDQDDQGGAGQSSQDVGSFGDVEDAPCGDSGDMKQAEAEAKKMVTEAITVAKQGGNMPEGIERLVDELLTPKVSWVEVLNRFTAEISNNDYTWTKPSPRYLASGIYLPKLENEEIGRIVMIVDTSISISRPILNRFSAELAEISTLINTPVTVLYVDEYFQGSEELVEGEPLHPIGGGCTDFRPGFDHIDSEGLDPKAVVYLTDGECFSFPEEPNYPVLWAKYGDYDFRPPFGEVMQIEN